MAEKETTPSATTLDVVKIAPRASPFNKLGINQSNGSNLLVKMRSESQATIKGYGGSQAIESMNVAEASVKTYITKLTRCEHGRSLHHNLWREVDFIKHECGRSLHLLTEKIYIPKFMARSLQIDSEEKDRLGTLRTAISACFLMGKTCAGSECSKNSGHLGPQGIVVDMTPVL
jgi:hypothetical protein